LPPHSRKAVAGQSPEGFSIKARRFLARPSKPKTSSHLQDHQFGQRHLGHLQIETTIDDPKIYAKPWTMKRVSDLSPDEEIVESICNENNKDPQHMVGK
jgi:hypothetical protein